MGEVFCPSGQDFLAPKERSVAKFTGCKIRRRRVGTNLRGVISSVFGWEDGILGCGVLLRRGVEPIFGVWRPPPEWSRTHFGVWWSPPGWSRTYFGCGGLLWGGVEPLPYKAVLRRICVGAGLCSARMRFPRANAVCHGWLLKAGAKRKWGSGG